MSGNPYAPPGSPLLIKNQRGEIVQRSKNLRGLITRAFRVGVNRAALHMGESRTGCVYVEFIDGTRLYTTFADFTVARRFLRSRYRRWGLDHESRLSDEYWSFF